MTIEPTPPILSRRGVLKVLAAAGITGLAAAGGYAVYESAPWLDYDQRVDSARRPFGEATAESARRRELVRYATLAASGHNAQPWRFTLHERAIDIRPDYGRRLPVVDPDDRELWISLGCALENLLVAARATGYVAEATYPAEDETIRVRISPAAAQASPWFDAVPLRQTTRSAYDGRPIPNADLDRLQALPLEPGVALRLITGPAERETVLAYVNEGNLRQYADGAFVDELLAWLRFNKREALASLDGLYTRCSGNPEAPRWLGRRFVAGTTPQQQADADAAKLRSSPAVVVLASEADDRTAWIRTGQVYERLALATTALNIKSAFLNQPIEVPDLRGQFQRAIGLGGLRPHLVVRLGYAAPLPWSPRRPVEHVIVPA